MGRAKLRLLLSLLVFCAFLSSGQAQTYIVDANGGSGVHFKDLPEAISKVPSGAVLRVRPGLYTEFTIANKALSIIGDQQDKVVVDKVNVTRTPTVGPTRFGQNVFLANLSFGPKTGFRLTGAVGPVVVDHVKLSPVLALVTVTSCVNVQFHDVIFGLPEKAPVSGLVVKDSSIEIVRSKIVGYPGGPYNTRNFPSPAGSYVYGNSRVVMIGCDVVGGAGRAGGGQGRIYPAAGGPGVHVLDTSSFLALGGSIQGGKGGNGDSFKRGADGGIGVKVEGGAYARVEGFSPQGGPGGSPGGNTGYRWTGKVTVNPKSVPPLASLQGTAAHNTTVQLTVKARPGSAAVLLMGLDAINLPLDPVAIGFLHCIPLLSVGPFPVPSTGTLQIPTRITPGWPVNQHILGQFAIFEPATKQLWASNSFVVLIKS